MHIRNLILLSAGIACLTCSCRSTGKELHRENRTEWTTEYKSRIRTDEIRQLHDSLRRLTEQDIQETVWVRTTTTRYDTSAQGDSLQVSSPILEQTVTCIEKNKTSANRTNEQQGSKLQTHRQTDGQSATGSTLTSFENSQQSPGGDPYRWRYMAIAAVAITVLAVVFIRKR